MKTDAEERSIVELERVARAFGKVNVLRDINLSLRGGEVVGLVGDNGAGKSTLVKIVSGYLAPTSGRLKVMGKQVRFTSPQQARNLGIETVYQDLAIIGQLSLWRNFFLGQEKGQMFFGLRVLDRSEMRRICLHQLRSFGLESVESADQLAGTLSGGERQVLALARAVYFKSRLLILDEPVAALSVRETRRVFQTMERVRKQGMGILYIDHNMSHVVPVADRIAVLEHGALTKVVRRGEMSADELSDLLARPASHE